MPFFTAKLNLKKPTETEEIFQDDYNDNLDKIDQTIEQHLADYSAHGLGTLLAEVNNHHADLTAHGTAMSLYKRNKDDFGVFTELQWKRPNGILAGKIVLSNGTPPYYTTKTVTYYQEDGTTAKEIKEYILTYDQDNDLISEVLQ